MQFGVWRLGIRRLLPNSGIGLFHHLLAEVNAHQIVLEDIVVEHVLGRLTEVYDPFGDGWGLHAEGHILGIGRAGSVVVAADAADAAGDEVRVPRVLPLHENAVTAEDRRSAVTLRHAALAEVDLGEDAETADDPGDRVPIHLD